MKQYTDIFLDFDDTLYDTHGNAVIALAATYEAIPFARYSNGPQASHADYW